MALIITSKDSTCNVFSGIVAGILMTIGLYFLVWGVATQWASSVVWNWWALLYYFAAIVLLGIGKHMCMASCPISK